MYLSHISKQYKLLSPADEVKLFTDLTVDKNLKETILLHNIRLVISVASKYRHDDTLDDLIQEGIIGLSEAIDNFDITLGFKFSTYAIPKIKSKIENYLLKYSKPISLKTNPKLYYALKKCIDSEYRLKNADRISIKKSLNVEDSDINTLLSLMSGVSSLDMELSEDFTLMDTLVYDDTYSLDDFNLIEYLIGEIKNKCSELPERDSKIFLKLRLENYTYKQLSSELELSIEKIKQIESKVLRFLQKNIDLRIIYRQSIGG